MSYTHAVDHIPYETNMAQQLYRKTENCQFLRISLNPKNLLDFSIIVRLYYH